MSRTRKPRGTPSGGQFAAGSNPEADVDLDATPDRSQRHLSVVAGGVPAEPSTPPELVSERLRIARLLADDPDNPAYAASVYRLDTRIGNVVYGGIESIEKGARANGYNSLADAVEDGRCPAHPAFEHDYCAGCGTQAQIGRW